MKTLTFLILLLSTFAHANKGNLTIYVDNSYPPFSYVQDGVLKGIYPALLKEIRQAEGALAFEVSPINWQAGKNKLRNSAAAAILGVYYEVQGHEFLKSYSVPVYTEEVVLICAKDRVDASVSQWPQDFKGKLVANVAGYNGWLRNNVRSDENTQFVNFLEVPDTGTALKMVVKGRLDCALFERHAYEYSLSLAQQDGTYAPGKDHQPFIAARISQETAHMGYPSSTNDCKDKPECAFSVWFDQQVKLLQSSGKMADIVRRQMSGQNK